MPHPITKDRAERIARSHACEHCLEYSFKKLVVRPASESQRKDSRAIWLVERVCGICGLETEIALNDEGDIVYVM